MEDTNISQKLVLKKDGNDHSILYQNNNHKMYRTLNENEYHVLFDKLRPNIDFSLPDRLIQSFVKDGTILPSYKNSRLFNSADFETIVSPLKKEMPYLSKIQSGQRNRRCNRRRGLGAITMKRGKQYKKNKILRNFNKKLLKNIQTMKNVNKRKETGKGKRGKGSRGKK